MLETEYVPPPIRYTNEYVVRLTDTLFFSLPGVVVEYLFRFIIHWMYTTPPWQRSGNWMYYFWVGSIYPWAFPCCESAASASKPTGSQERAAETAKAGKQSNNSYFLFMSVSMQRENFQHLISNWITFTSADQLLPFMIFDTLEDS